MLEGYSALSFMAAVTQHVTLGTMVTGVNYRAPGFLIKTVTTLDVLSGGRAWLGIGAGWFEEEAHGLGLPFPPLKERFERLEETLNIATKVWSGDFSEYKGKHYHLANPLISPLPVQKPKPRILIGGTGEKKTLRFVAKYADACNLFAFGDPAGLVPKLDVLKQHCDAVGRNYNDIERTVLAPFTGDVAAAVAHGKALAAIGSQHVIFSGVPNVNEVTPVERIGREVIPAVANL